MKGLFFGLLTIDLQFYTDHYPEENSKIKAKKFDAYIGGPATNAAVTFNHLGGNSVLITSIGINPFNSMVYEDLGQYEIEVNDILAGEKADPVFASIITSKSSGERTVFSYYPPKISSKKYIETPTGLDLALFDGFYIESAVEQAKACQKQGITTVFDGGSWKKHTDELLDYIDIAICSEDFLPPGVIHQTDVTEYLMKKGVKYAAITRGNQPIIANEGQVNLIVEVPETDVVDTLGAGDIFHGAFCHFYLKDKNFISSLEKAAQLASYSCQFQGPRAWMDSNKSE